jgi:DNA ligase-1
MAKKIPTAVFLFECLFVDGEDLTQKPYQSRREKLFEIVEENPKFLITPSLEAKDPNKITNFFEEAIAMGCEGLIIKSTGLDSIYRAGARSWLWVKLKRSYQSKMIEPVDLTIVGAFMGRGKRGGTYGALLAAVYDKKDDVFRTVCKVGSGFTDDHLSTLPKMFKAHRVQHRHARVDSILDADLWFHPAVVIEVIGDEITLSPIHSCAFNQVREETGLAIRFPRFTGRWRLDKSPEDSTSVRDIIEMYQSQMKKI